MTPLDDELRRALGARASRLTPPSDPLAGIESRARGIQRRRQALAGGGAAAVVLAVAVAVPLATRGNNDRPQIAAAQRTESVAPSPTAEPTTAPTAATTSPAASAVPTATTAPPAETVLAALYYLGETKLRPVLYREFRRVEVAGDDDATKPISTAVTAMLQPALDPDYQTLWPAGTALQSVRTDGEVGTIDLNDAALRGKAGSQHACLTLQQLVWTVTAADKSVKRVLVTVNGKADGVVSEWWGVGCGKDEPMARHAPSYEVLAPVQISNPSEGATVRSKFAFGGEATVFEANVTWSVVDKATGKVLKEGFSTATAGAPARGTWEASVTLDSVRAGQQLELRAWESSAEDGSVQFLDTKTVTVA
jgi:spore germination protein GerM